MHSLIQIFKEGEAMKLVKLSLVAALAAGSFSVLEAAKPLEDAIKNVQLGGFMWYRYDSGRFKDKNLNLDAGGIGYTQVHRYRVGLTANVDLGEGFRAVGMFLYNDQNNPSFHNSYSNTNFAIGQAKIDSPFWLKQAYIQYNNADAGLSISLGRQNLNTIWTDDFAGMMAKITLRPTDEVTVGVFGVDSFQNLADDSGRFGYYNTIGGGATSAIDNRLYKENLYGANVLGNFGPLKAEIWGAHWDKTATLYALKLDFDLGVFRVHANYLGNSVDGVFKTDTALGDKMGNGNLANLKLAFKVAGFDANVGGIYFGAKDKFTINTIEEPFGNDSDLYIGSEIFYQQGSYGNISFGQNAYGYVGVGYTLPAQIRIGLKGVFGATMNDDAKKTIGGVAASTTGYTDHANNGGGTKMEGVAEISWQATKGLNFLAYYSYLHTSADNGKLESGTEAGGDAVYSKVNSAKNTVRFQARYAF